MRDLMASYLLSNHQNIPRWGRLPTHSSKASLAEFLFGLQKAVNAFCTTAMAPKDIQSHGFLCSMGNCFITKKTGLGCKTSRFKHSWHTVSAIPVILHIFVFSLDLSNLLWENKSQVSSPLFYLSHCLYFGPLFPLSFSEIWKDFFPILVFSS